MRIASFECVVATRNFVEMLFGPCAAIVMVLSAVPADAQQANTVNAQPDPAVVAYNTFIKGVNLNTPLDTRLVAGLLDQLAGTAEGVAIGRGVTDDDFFSRIRRGRRELRRFVETPIGTDGRQQRGHQIFDNVAQLLKDLERKLGSNASTKPAVEAVERAARSLEVEEPLRWQPDGIENFLVLGGEALKQLSAAAPTARR